jgi:hypothetical protein
MFFAAAESGDVEYDPVNNEYSVGFIGNGAAVTFALASGGTGTINIDIYENNYRLRLIHDETAFFDETRNKPYLNLNIACGGSCPPRTSFSCLCEGSGDRSCYYVEDGTITKVFEGNATP